jgi:hypothetical protein
MPRYYFQIAQGPDLGAHGASFDAPDREAAWIEMTRVCSDLIRGVTRDLKQNSDWKLELLTEAKKPLFRIRITAETLGARTSLEVCEPADS